MSSWGRRVVQLALLCSAGCGSIEVHKSTSTLDYLYPAGTPALPAQDVALQVPVRVALAFAPGEHKGGSTSSGIMPAFGLDSGQVARADPLTEVERTAILERIAADLRTRDFVEGVDVIPSSYLTAGGSFANLDQIAHAFGSDVAVLLSYDQSQFNNTSGWSLTYWTILGAYVVKGEENETQTFLDAAVFDIPSHALLFRAAGTATSGSSATPVDTPHVMQEASVAGFDGATTALIAQLDAALEEFGKQAAKGTVRGQGTPALAVTASEEYSGVAKFENGRYTGALGLEALLAAVLLLAAAAGARRAARAAG
jgi:rhombotail lipoprotein